MRVTHIAYDAPDGALVTAGVEHLEEIPRGRAHRGLLYRADASVDSTRLALAHFESREEASEWADRMARCYAFEVHGEPVAS